MFIVVNDLPKAEGHIEGKVGPLMHNSAAYAAGDIISTAGDLELFDRALRNNVLISKESTELISKTHAKSIHINTDLVGILKMSWGKMLLGIQEDIQVVFIIMLHG